MITFLNTLVDRCMFTLTFILGVQLPEFINQYIQRLSGHLEESKQQLSSYQALAEQYFNGEISLLIKQYKENSEPMIVDSAKVIEQLLQRTEYLANHLSSLNTNDYFQQLTQFALNFDPQLLKKTAEFYQLAIPLTINALSTGAVIAFLFVLVNFICVGCIKRYLHKQKNGLTLTNNH
ncbi:DUF2937 family protein [Thalassotalea sp. SU-HH00458]|uniref:DUF2937 family protein n=1 Tax=Thalassotalea sp. SU-HH00458 TaxID=3127657 RepID=UPI00336564EF